MADPSGIAIDPIPASRPTWGPSIDGDEVSRLRSRVDVVSDDAWDEVVETAARILGRCPIPTTTTARVTGLALGKVQSGKTLSYTALIALAVDNGYRITVVLAGTKKGLLEQSYSRLRNDLAVPQASITPFKNPEPLDAGVIQSVLYGGGHALLVVLKHGKRLDNLKRVLSSLELRGYPTLIIDDEGDEASLNTQFRRGRQSAIYRSILSVRDVLDVHAYIAYTATPQANLLISGIDGLSPDFGVLIEPGEGYCGGSTFFGPDRVRYVRVVPSEEADVAGYEGIPDGLRRAVAAFLVGGAIRHLRTPAAWHSMLIHNSVRRDDHATLRGSIQTLIEAWRERLQLPDADPATQELLAPMREAYDDLCATVQAPPPWEDVRRQLQDEAQLLEVWMVNSLPVGRDPIRDFFRLRNNILIGGNMLGRGVTIDGLAVTYITRRAQRETNADTMEQRGRWFGYKQSYLDLCRIFTTSQLRDDYTRILRHEDDFWEALRRNERQGLSIREWPRMLALDVSKGLRPTRTNVAAYRSFRGENWDVQRSLIEDESTATANVDAVRRFFALHPGVAQQFGNVEHVVVEDCPTETVISDLLADIQDEGGSWDGAYTREYLARLLVSGALPSLDVVFMSGGRVRSRRKGKEGQINPMQGRSPGRDPSDPAFYPGDEYIHGGKVQLQVHVVRVRDSGAETTALALFIPPDDPRFDLRYVVRDAAT